VLPVRKDITQAVYASGKAYPTRYYKVVASVPGYLGRLLVQVGDTVHRGQALFTVQNDAGTFNLEASRNTLAQANRNAAAGSPILQAAKADAEAARAKLTLDSLTYARYAGLQQAGAGTRQRLDEARTQYETSRATYVRSMENLEATSQRVQTERQNAEATYNALRAGQDNYTVYSTLDGMVYDQVPRPGEFVGPNTVVMEIGERKTFEVDLAIDESDLNYVRTGQQVFFAAEALGKELASGVITKVYPKISSQSKSIRAVATLALPAGKTVFAGSTLEANIVCATHKNALVLPKAYVHNDSVVVRREGDYVKIPVVIGLEDADFVEVRQGITAQTEVYKKM
jgi:multidrug efflux pump subunit AcrA (membrane-fusion protein)